MAFVELIINESQNTIIAAQELSIDREENHDWGLETGEIFVRIEGKLPLISGIFDPWRYLWNPTTRQLDFIPESKSGLELHTDSITQKQDDYDVNIGKINSATTIDEIKPVLKALLGVRPIMEALE
ncbi:MAG: hypothetical protein KAQ99_07105 [Candidatus Aureabacteria bacterium]|nr:hypothetical protein [Candidatus Auribacterota bacterium]